MGKTKKNKQNPIKMLSVITTGFKEITEDPAQFLLVIPEERQKAIKSLLEQTYKACIQHDKESKKTPDILPKLVVQDMDEEQIWQQLELRNNALLTGLIDNTSKLLALREEKLEVRLDEGEEENESDEEEDGEEEDNDSEEDEEKNAGNEFEEDDEEPEFFKRDKEFKKKRKVRSSIVDDKFFKLGEMEAFLEQEDAKEMRKKGKPDDSIDTGIDYFADDLGIDDEDEDEDEDEANPTYRDFFDEDEDEDEEEMEKGAKKAAKKPKDHFKDEASDEQEEIEQQDDEQEDDAIEMEEEEDDEDAGLEMKNENDDRKGGTVGDALQPASSGSDDDSEDEEKPQSSYQVRQTRLEQRMREYEDIVLGEKPWQLRGEVQATSRPQNSLLEEVLEFESTMAPPPIITETTTRRLEDIIKQRIRDQAWDDPVYTMRPVQTASDLRKQLILDQEKSKESLAQVYEKEYQKELDKFDPARADAAEEETKEHKEIKRLMRAVFVKLDALSNFHFTPKPVAPEARIITNTPAVTMEEVAPVAVSDAKLLAPEEVYRGPKNGALLGKTERTRTDKNRERRKKKQKQRVIHRLLDEKSKKKQEQGIAPTKKEESAKLLKSLTKHRNVEKLNTTSDDQRALKSSKSFFSKLQDTTSSAGQAALATKAKKQKSSGQTITAKRVKL